MKAAALVLATILATPFAFDYDLMVLAPAIAFLALDVLARGARPYEKTGVALLWLVPLVARSIAASLAIPIGIAAVIAVFGLTLRRSARDLTNGEPARPLPESR